MKHVLAVCVVVMAGVVGGVSVATAGAPAVAESPNRNTFTLQIFDGLQDLIERIDQFLESLVDLLETLQQLFGGGAGED